jgi:hypothetical protein
LVTKPSKFNQKLNNLSWSTHLRLSAVVSGIIYLFVFTLPFPLATFYDTIPPVDYTKLTNYSRTGFLAYIFGLGALFGLYFWSVRLLAPAGAGLRGELAAYDNEPQPAVTGRFIFLVGAIFGLILLFSYPLTAIDLFIYAIRTRGWALYGLPPLSTPPEALPPSDSWLGLAGEWIDAASPYGPLWEWLSLGAFYIANGDFLGHLFALKTMGLLAYLGCSGLIYQVLRVYKPDWALTGTVAFAWNPLALFESVQNAHNDILMIFFLLVAVWLLGQRQRSQNASLIDMLICLGLALSILVKFVTVLVVPFFVLAMAMPQPSWLRRAGRLSLYTLVIGLLVAAPMLAIWPGWADWAVLKASSGAGRSLLALLILGLRDWLGTNRAFDLAQNLILAVLAMIYLYHLWRTVRTLHDRPASLLFPDVPINPLFFVLFWYVLIAIPVFHAWYILWFLPLAPLLLPQQRPLMAAIIFSTTALFVIPYFETLRVWYPTLLENHFLGHLIGVPLLILPPALTLLWPAGSTTDSEV